MGTWLRQHWQGLAIGILIAVLAVCGQELVLFRAKYAIAVGEIKGMQSTLVNQTKMIVELRGKLAPMHFGDSNELKQWVEAWERDNKPIVLQVFDRNIVLSGNDELYSRYWDCDDLAEAMQRDALADGYLMSSVLVDSNGLVYGVRVSELSNHMGTMVVAGNAFWYVEPQTGGMVMIVERDENFRRPRLDLEMPKLQIPMLPLFGW